jgi:hypothetical protein
MTPAAKTSNTSNNSIDLTSARLVRRHPVPLIDSQAYRSSMACWRLVRLLRVRFIGVLTPGAGQAGQRPGSPLSPGQREIEFVVPRALEPLVLDRVCFLPDFVTIMESRGL